MIEVILIIFNATSQKSQYYIYHVGRDNNYFKAFITFALKSIIKSILIIYLAFLLCSLIIVIINTILAGNFITLDKDFYTNAIDTLRFDTYIGEKFLLLFMLFIVWIPAFIEVTIVSFYAIMFYEKSRSLILTIIFIIFIFIVTMMVVISLDRNLIYFVPTYPIMNIQSMGGQVVSWLSVIIQLVICFILLKIRKWCKWDEI